MFSGEQRGVRRAHSPDSYDNAAGGQYNNNFQRGPPQWGGRGGHHQQPNFKRHRGEHYQAHLSLDDQISRLGEIGYRHNDIDALAKEIDSDLCEKGQDEERVRALTARICRCIVSFPTRIGTYTTLIGLVTIKHYNVTCQIINTLHASYPVYLEAQKWQEALTIIHSLASLVNCNVIRPSALLSQFEFLLESTLEDNIPQTRSDYFAYTVLSSLPYVAQELANQDETAQNFDKLLGTIESYLSKRSKEHLRNITVWASDDSTIQMDYLDSLWVQIKNFRATGWNETFLHRPYNEKEHKENMKASLIPTNSPTFQIPGHSDKCVYPYPRIVLRLYEDDVVEGSNAIPGSDKIERFCIENHIRNIIDELSNDLKGCARHLINMYHSDTLPIKHLLIETILGELFTLPKPKHDEVLYYTLLFEFTKLFHMSTVPEEIKFNYGPILNNGVKVLYDNVDSMNITCYTRFVRWFSFHLNNIDFVFPWQTWQDATCKPKNSPKSMFVQDMLDRCIRLSFHKKINKLVEAELSSLMPPEVCVAYRPVFAENPRAGELAGLIKRLILDKADGPTICQTLNIKIDNVELPDDFMLKEEKLAEQLLKIDIFTAVILDIASKSLTHLSSAIGKYRNVFKALTRIPQGQVQLLQTMHSCLEMHPQLKVILVDKLLKADLIGAKEVCNWIFSESMKQFHTKSYPWEILENTLYRVRRSLERLEAERDRPKEPEIDKDAEQAAKKKEEDGGDGAKGGNTPKHEPDVDMIPISQGDKVMEEESEEQKAEAAKKEREALDKQIEEARSAYKGIVLHTFQLFSNLLSDHIRDCEKAQVSFMDVTFHWLTGRMQEVYYAHLELIRGFYYEVKTIIDATPSIGNVIVNLNQ